MLKNNDSKISRVTSKLIKLTVYKTINKDYIISLEVTLDMLLG